MEQDLRDKNHETETATGSSRHFVILAFAMPEKKDKTKNKIKFEKRIQIMKCNIYLGCKCKSDGFKTPTNDKHLNQSSFRPILSHDKFKY